MPRATADEVEKIIEVQAGTDLDPFITAANGLVNNACVYVPPYDDDLLTTIETWLAAHFYAVFDGQIQAAKAGTVNVTYQARVAMGLKATLWGQQAMVLDFKGGLAAVDNANQTKKRTEISIAWLGIPNDCRGRN